MKVSILMPTYNDERFISTAIDSVIAQTYPNWELLIMDDGSTDNTSPIVNSYTDDRIKYFHQTNQGQLKALKNLCSYITGDVVMMLHSDDLLYSDKSLELNIKYFSKYDIDGIYSSIVHFYQSGKPDRITDYSNALCKKATLKLLMLLGSNFIPDPFFIKKHVFFMNVYHNYLNWNFQYWLDFKYNSVTSLNLHYSEHPWYYYRISDENYSNSIIGNFETFFGRLRSVYLLSEYYTVPFPAIQKELVRKYNIKGFAFNHKASKKHLALLIKQLIKNMQKRTPGAYTWYFDQLLSFYSNTEKKQIKLTSAIKSSYLGNESRQFFKDLNENTLPPVYNEILANYPGGFSSILVYTEQDKSELENILKFLCLRADIEIQ